MVQVIVSIAVAAANSNATGGLKSASFAAIWSMFLVIAFTGVGAQIVFGGRSTELLVGFMIGTAAMLTELFFVLMVIFFVLGQTATDKGYSKLMYCCYVWIRSLTSGIFRYCSKQ